MATSCCHCHQPLPASSRNPRQRFCGSPQCQRARKRQWQQNKIKTDPAYKLNQRQANRDWQKKNPGYWKRYRQKNPAYTESNRAKTRQRMEIKRQLTGVVRMFAKMDASLVDPSKLSGYYGLIPFSDMFAKMDASLIKINIFLDDIDKPGHVCKERTVSPPLPALC